MTLVRPDLCRHQQDWEELATADPLWAILTDPKRRGGRWELSEFFESGKREIAAVLATAAEEGYPRAYERALDFGCGVGRLTRAMSSRFQECHGVDISERMIDLALQLNREHKNCIFHLNVRDDLSSFDADTFDFVYSALVLQHQRTPAAVERYVSEFLRVLRPGGLAVFQMLSHIPWIFRLQPRRRAYALLRRLGASQHFLIVRARLTPARGIAVPEPVMRRYVARADGQVVRVEGQAHAGAIGSSRYFVSLAASTGSH